MKVTIKVACSYQVVHTDGPPPDVPRNQQGAHIGTGVAADKRNLSRKKSPLQPHTSFEFLMLTHGQTMMHAYNSEREGGSVWGRCYLVGEDVGPLSAPDRRVHPLVRQVAQNLWTVMERNPCEQPARLNLGLIWVELIALPVFPSSIGVN